MRNVVVIFVGPFLALSTFMLISAYLDGQTSVQPGERLSGQQLLTQWERDYALYDTYSRTPIRLAYIKGLSKRFTKALGRADINFETGEVTLNIGGLEPLPDGFIYEAWLVNHVPGDGNSVALDLGAYGDRFINLGTLPLGGSTVASVDPKGLADFEVDMAAVVQVGPNEEPEFIAGGFQSIAFKTIWQAKLQQERDGFNWLTKKVEAAGVLAGLIEDGEDIFFNETFDGNGRTCGTCHRAGDSFAISPAFIQGLSADDPLFVSGFFNGETLVDANEFLPPGFFEDPVRMFLFSHILENQDGFDEVCGFDGTDDGVGDFEQDCIAVADPLNSVCDEEKCEYPDSISVRLTTPTVINTLLTEPLGLGGDIPDLRAFSTGAVVQHIPKTLNRRSKGKDRDFRLPKKIELDALEAFQQSILLPQNVTDTDPSFNPFALAETDAVIRGAALFQAGAFGAPAIKGSAGKCSGCHTPPTLGDSGNFDTGVNALAFSQALPFDDSGANTGAFVSPTSS